MHAYPLAAADCITPQKGNHGAINAGAFRGKKEEKLSSKNTAEIVIDTTFDIIDEIDELPEDFKDLEAARKPANLLTDAHVVTMWREVESIEKGFASECERLAKNPFNPELAREERINAVKRVNQYLRCESAPEKNISNQSKQNIRWSLISKSHWILGLSTKGLQSYCA